MNLVIASTEGAAEESGNFLVSPSVGLMIWLLPPSEIEAHLKERGMSGDRR